MSSNVYIRFEGKIRDPCGMMVEAKKMRLVCILALLLGGSIFPGSKCQGFVPSSDAPSNQPQQETSQSATTGETAKPVGTVKAINGNVMTLTTDAGSTVNLSVQESTRMVRITPGEKDLKKGTFIKLRDVQVGDRILARGTSSDGGKSVMASSVILMKESDLTAKQEHDREDWQKRGVGGLVSKVDAGKRNHYAFGPTLTDAKPVT